MACKKPRIVVSTGLLVSEYERMNVTLELCPPGTSASALLRESLKLVMAIGASDLSKSGFLSDGMPQQTIDAIRNILTEQHNEQ